MRYAKIISLVFFAGMLLGCATQRSTALPRYWLGESQPVANAPMHWKGWQDDPAFIATLVPEGLRTQLPFAQLDWVQKRANAQPFRADIGLWGREDYWARPSEFFRYGGDCEDYVLAKLALLRALGWEEERMRVLLVQDMARGGMEHAVLWVSDGDRFYLLDNQTRDLLDAETQRRYLPRYGMNATGFWRY